LEKIFILIPVNFFPLVAADETLDIGFVIGCLHAAKLQLTTNMGKYPLLVIKSTHFGA
jgi:hypothetical protein